MLEWQQIIAYIVTPLLTLAIGVFHLYLNGKFSSLKEKIIDQDALVKDVAKKHFEELALSAKETAEIRNNYIGRFEDIKENVHKVKDEILLKINDMDKKVDKQAVYCAFVQEQKRKN